MAALTVILAAAMAAGLAGAPPTGAWAQSEPLPDYAPLLPQVRARAWPVDPAIGYAIRAVKPGVFVVTDGGYQAMAVATGQGVVLFDAPPSLAPHLVQAVASVTREPIVTLVYSHAHVDHIGGAGLILKQRPGLEIVAEEGTATFLREMRDPDRPPPTRMFRDHETLRLGTLSAELSVHHWHSPTGDLFIYLPDARVLMAVDAFSAGSVPFMGLDLTQDVDEYRKVFDEMLALDWDVVVPGHHSNPATREDVVLARSYVDDVLATAARAEAAGDATLAAAATRRYGRENTYPVASVLIDREVARCAGELVGRWGRRLDNVDVWAPSHCRTALVYAEWDVGPHGHPVQTAGGTHP